MTDTRKQYSAPAISAKGSVVAQTLGSDKVSVFEPDTTGQLPYVLPEF